jgi:hypothetical protein
MTLFRKHTSISIFLVALLALVLAGCGSDNKSSTAGATQSDGASGTVTAAKGVQPPPVQLLSGNETGIKVNKPTAYVIHTQTGLTALLAKHSAGKGVSSASLSAGDYKTRQTVAVFLPATKNGTSLYIDNVSPKDGKIVITAVKVPPGEGCKVGPKKARPFAIVDTARMTEKSTKIVLTSQPNGPC